MKRIIPFFVGLFMFVQTVQAGTIRLDEEGTSQGYIANLNCVGADVTCSRNGITGEINISAGAGSGDSVTVNTTSVDTTADFVDSLYIDFVHTDGGAGGPDSVSAKYNYALTLAGNHGFSVDECVIGADTSGGFIICEGSTADNNEQMYRLPNVNGADTTEYLLFADDANVSAAEAGYLDGVTSAIQTQIDGKEGTLTNEAGLYAALSDVSQFYEPNDNISAGTIAASGLNTANAGIATKNGATGPGFVDFYEDSDDGTNKTMVKAQAQAGDLEIILPAAAGTVGQVLEIASVAAGVITTEWDDDGGAAGGDSVTVASTAVDTTANFVDTGGVKFTLADGGAGGPDDISAALALDDMGDPDANSAVNMSTTTFDLNWTSPAVGAMAFNITGAGSGNFFEINQNTGNMASGSKLMRIIGADSDVTQLHLDHLGDQASRELMRMQLNRATTTDNDEVYSSYYFDQDGNFTSQGEEEFARFSAVATDVSENTEDASFTWDLMTDGTLAESMSLTSSLLSAPTFSSSGKVTANAGIDTKNGALGPGFINIYEDSDDGTNYTAIKSQAQAATLEWVLPAANGTVGQVLEIASVVSDTLTLEWDDDGGAGGGGSTTVPLYPYSAKITGAYVTATITNLDVASQGAQIDAGDGNWRVLFDATTDEAIVFYSILPSNYGSAPVVNLIYSLASATTAEVEWEAAVMCVTPGDAADIATASFAAGAAGGGETVPGTAGHTDTLESITPTDDSCAAGDIIYTYVSTDANDATNDDATGDRELTGAYLSFTE